MDLLGPYFSDSRHPMIIFSDSREPIFNSRDPNRVLKHLKKRWLVISKMHNNVHESKLYFCITLFALSV